MRIREEILSYKHISEVDCSIIQNDVLVSFMHYYREHREEIITLDQNGFAHEIRDVLSDLASQVIGDMPASSIRHYDIYGVSGAMYNVTMQWLLLGCVESDEEMAAYLAVLAIRIIN